MKCTRCKERAEVQLRAHNAAFCRPCFIMFFQRQVERAIAHEKMFNEQEKVVVAVSGGKDSLALWDALLALGYRPDGLYLGLGIGDYSDASQRAAQAYADKHGLTLRVIHLEEDGLGVPEVAATTRRTPCAACGAMKRHYFDTHAIEGDFDVLATGHNLDDEAARLLGNVLHWQTDHLARQRPVLEPTHEKFVRKVKPLYLVGEYESAIYAFFRGIEYVVEECPNATGATQLIYKDVLNRIEVESPGTKQRFVKDFLRNGQPKFVRPEGAPPPNACERCGMPAFGTLCSFCHLVREVETKRAKLAASA